MMNQNSKPILIISLLILILNHGSDASFFGKFRKLGGHNPELKEPPQISPWPGPPEISPAPEPIGIDSFTEEKCLIPSKRCRDQGNITACLTSSPSDLFLVVKNGGESTLKVNVTISHTYQEIQISGQHTTKVKISATAGGSPSVVLNAGNGKCIINVGSPVTYGNIFQLFPSYATPINGAYLLFLTLLIIGGTWACCKLAKRGRQVDGIPYQELEMGQPDSLAANNVETTEGWDEDWDDDWTETKAVKSPSASKVANVSANGFTSRSSDKDGWENNWDE